jgi:hypothetical protein
MHGSHSSPREGSDTFNLIYATRDSTGVKVFKEAERKGMSVMEQARGEAHRRGQEQRVGHVQLGLRFGDESGRDLPRISSRCALGIPCVQKHLFNNCLREEDRYLTTQRGLRQ